MKRILKFFLGAIIASAAIGAQAQTQTLASQIKIGAGATFNLSAVYQVSIKPGNMYFVGANGRQVPFTLAELTQIINSTAWRDFAEVRDGLYNNLTKTTMTYCEPQRGTVVEWIGRTPELVPDGCAHAYRVDAFSRAR